MIRVLVTGAEGQLGMCLQKTSPNYSDIQFFFKNKSELDITKKENINKVFKNGKFNFCINCAAFTNVEEAERTPEMAFAVNTEGVRNLAVACLTYKVKLVHISTDYVFDGEKKEGYFPSDQPNPINEYGRSKWEGEKHIQKILKDYLIIRTSWLYSEHGQNFYKSILEKARRGEILHVTDSQVGCPTNANHLAVFIINIILAPHFEIGIYHFVDEKAMTWYDFAKKIVKENHLEPMVKIVRDKKYRTFAKRPINSVLK